MLGWRIKKGGTNLRYVCDGYRPPRDKNANYHRGLPATWWTRGLAVQSLLESPTRLLTPCRPFTSGRRSSECRSTFSDRKLYNSVENRYRRQYELNQIYGQHFGDSCTIVKSNAVSVNFGNLCMFFSEACFFVDASAPCSS
jgi:hypothetical protein